jgi:hypothetical protein
VVHEYRLQAMKSARRVLQAEARIARKARLGARLVGRSGGRSPADRQTAWHELLESWLAVGEDIAAGTSRARTATITSSTSLRAAIVCAHSVIGTHVLAVVRRRDGGLWVSDRADALLDVSQGRWPRRCRDRPAAADNAPTRALDTGAIRRALRCWITRTRMRAALGVARTEAGVSHSTGQSPPTRSQQRALAWLHSVVASWSTVQRRQLQVAVDEARHCIVSASGVGCETALRDWTEQSGHPETAVRGWQEYPELVRAVANDRVGPAAPNATAEPGRVRVVGCLRIGGHKGVIGGD